MAASRPRRRGAGSVFLPQPARPLLRGLALRLRGEGDAMASGPRSGPALLWAAVETLGAQLPKIFPNLRSNPGWKKGKIYLSNRMRKEKDEQQSAQI
ncbi:uncharacterized protein PHA67_004664 isoform 4-T4 [Liasis olivaceus]